jgi:hypothetical protein
MIPAVILPDGYRGKILLVLIVVGEESLAELRSGDLWHREILRNTEAEVFNLGRTDAQVNELGGAFLFFEADGSIRIRGGSDEFGACDRDYAAALVKAARRGAGLSSRPEKWLDFCLYLGVQAQPNAGGCKADVQGTTGRIRT